MRYLITATFFLYSPLAGQQGRLPAWQLVEDLRIGAVDGPQGLSKVSSLTVSSDGSTLYVAQQLEHVIRVFDARSGKPLRTIGRSGEGPGEFRYLSRLGWRADSLYATDFALQRLSLFSPAGEHYWTGRVNPPIQPDNARGSFPIGLTANGSVISQAQLASRSVAEGSVTTSPWTLVARDGAILGTVAMRDLRETTTAVPIGSTVVFTPQPMSRRTFIAIHPDGASIAVVSQPAGRDPPGTFRVTRVGPDGGMIGSREYSYRPQPMPRAYSDSIYDLWAERFEHWLPPGRARDAANKYILLPNSLPPVADVVLSRDNSLWLRSEDAGKPLVTWTLLDPAGSVHATVSAPSVLSIMYVDARAVWGVVHDQFDVPYVVRYRVQR